MMNTKQNDAMNRTLRDIAERAAICRADIHRVVVWKWKQQSRIAMRGAVVNLWLFILAIATRPLQPDAHIRAVVFSVMTGVNLLWFAGGLIFIERIARRDIETVRQRWGFDPHHPLMDE